MFATNITKENSYGSNLLVSLLVRYPQLGTVTFNHHKESLELTFMLSKIPDKDILEATKTHILESISCYHYLEEIIDAKNDFQFQLYDHVALIKITRDIATLSKKEIALIVALIQQKFSNLLIMEDTDYLPEEDMIFQEQMIESLLYSANEWRIEHGLIGFRENGRVMVFHT